MKQITIKVTVPNKEDVWKVSIGKGRPRKKKNAVEVYRHAERFLSQKIMTSSASYVGNKIDVLVDYSIIHNDKPLEWINEGLYTRIDEALYVAACFLEDFLPIRYQKAKYKLYGEEFIHEGGDVK